MKWTGLNDLREQFILFFEAKGHTRLASFSLVPQGDNSLLLINSGMAPLKPYFLGQKQIANNRATGCQKCIRTPDIDRVGLTSRHGTFFEMLGSFSFGDYFKSEAITWAWEFVTKELEIPVEKLNVTIYEEDDEAYEIWANEVGVAPDHISRLGKEDNYWEIGAGPCGPCSELYYDRGAIYGCGSPDCHVGCDCDRYIEFWNLVFSQYISDGCGNYKENERKNIDTGMGLERIACIMQGVDNLFEVDTIRHLLNSICAIAQKEYGKNAQDDVSIRVITDHIRSSVFMISDQIMPSNEGRGYILRRLLRRAMRHGRKLGIDKPFLFEVCEAVISESKLAYPELETNRKRISKIIKAEEEKFQRTIDQGLALLCQMLAKLKSEGKDSLPGELAFKLYDTFGFPLEITEEVAAEEAICVDKDKFAELMNQQQELARAARKKQCECGWSEGEEDLYKSLSASRFVGSEALEVETNLVALFQDGKSMEQVSEGAVCRFMIEQTPFYSTGGGQVSDTGVLIGPTGKIEVLNSQKLSTGQTMLTGEVLEGEFAVGQRVLARVDAQRRQAICKNHSACHLLQKALQEVLGSHVAQAGSYVDDLRLRFDFSHFEALTQEELLKVENWVNEAIFSSLPVTVKEMKLEDAKALGAMALFGEKYSDVVRVCNISNRSIELCGGTHVSNTAQINIFKIASETSVAAGVRRIEAVTAKNALVLINQVENLLEKTRQALKVGLADEIEGKVFAIAEELVFLRKELLRLKQQGFKQTALELCNKAVQLEGVWLLVSEIEDADANDLKTICDFVKEKLENAIIVLSSLGQRSQIAVCVCGESLSLGFEAGKIVKRICAKLGGGGGGKKELAIGSVLKLEGLEATVLEIIKEPSLKE